MSHIKIIKLLLCNSNVLQFLIIGMLLTSCARGLYTYPTLPNGKAYSKPSIVLLTDTFSHDFMTAMKSKFEGQFKKNGIAVEIQLLKMNRHLASVLSKHQIDSVQRLIPVSTDRDLVVLINPTHTSTYIPDGMETIWSTKDRVVSILFQIVGLDAGSNLVVWTAAYEVSSENEFLLSGNGGSVYGTNGFTSTTSPPPPSVLKEVSSASRIIFKRLVSDKVVERNRTPSQ